MNATLNSRSRRIATIAAIAATIACSKSEDRQDVLGATDGGMLDASAIPDPGAVDANAANRLTTDATPVGSSAWDASVAPTDVGAPDVADRLADCPFAKCAREFELLAAACPTNVACMAERTGTQMNECYDNGVRTYWDQDRGTFLTPAGRTCYVLEIEGSNGDYTAAVMDGSRKVLSVRWKDEDTGTYECDGRRYDLAWQETRCGALNLFGGDCAEGGSCLRP